MFSAFSHHEGLVTFNHTIGSEWQMVQSEEAIDATSQQLTDLIVSLNATLTLLPRLIPKNVYTTKISIV